MDFQELQQRSAGVEPLLRGLGPCFAHLDKRSPFFAAYFWESDSHPGYFHARVTDASGCVETRRPMLPWALSPWLNLQTEGVHSDIEKLELLPSRHAVSLPPQTVKKTEPEPSRVYFIQGIDGGPVKIGFSNDVRERIACFQMGSPVLLQVIGTTLGGIELEHDFHRRMAPHRLHGEWFIDCDDLRALIAEVCK